MAIDLGALRLAISWARQPHRGWGGRNCRGQREWTHQYRPSASGVKWMMSLAWW